MGEMTMPNKKQSDALYKAFMDIVENESPEQAIGELESLKMLYFNRCAFLKWKENNRLVNDDDKK